MWDETPYPNSVTDSVSCPEGPSAPSFDFGSVDRVPLGLDRNPLPCAPACRVHAPDSVPSRPHNVGVTGSKRPVSGHRDPCVRRGERGRVTSPVRPGPNPREGRPGDSQDDPRRRSGGRSSHGSSAAESGSCCLVHSGSDVGHLYHQPSPRRPSTEPRLCSSTRLRPTQRGTFPSNR